MAAARLSFETEPSRYRHWKLDVDPPIATLSMAVDPSGLYLAGVTTGT